MVAVFGDCSLQSPTTTVADNGDSVDEALAVVAGNGD